MSTYAPVGYYWFMAGMFLLGIYLIWSSNDPPLPWHITVGSGILLGTVLALGLTLLILIILAISGPLGLFIVLTLIIGTTIWVQLGPVVTVLICALAVWTLWRWRLPIARAFGATAPDPQPAKDPH